MKNVSTNLPPIFPFLEVTRQHEPTKQDSVRKRTFQHCKETGKISVLSRRFQCNSWGISPSWSRGEVGWGGVGQQEGCHPGTEMPWRKDLHVCLYWEDVDNLLRKFGDELMILRKPNEWRNETIRDSKKKSQKENITIKFLSLGFE